jgi:4-diphosphocytidyl-2-C-methyl-D-erythritol kinase
LEITARKLREIALELGADVPMCLESRPLVARGIGEDIRVLNGFPKLHLLLVNPLAEVSTPTIFKLLTEKNNPPLAIPSDGAGSAEWLAALQGARNDLQPPAEKLESKITEALALLADTKPLFARMSGSGATCFGVYEAASDRDAALAVLESKQPGWYLEATVTL